MIRALLRLATAVPAHAPCVAPVARKQVKPPLI
jgi:hypothetical protein